MSEARPAWSQQFAPDAIRTLSAAGPLGEITREWAWGGSTGTGVRVAVVDSGIEHDHPRLGGARARRRRRGAGRARWMTPSSIRRTTRRRIFPATARRARASSTPSRRQAELYSVRVLGRNMGGKALQFAAGLEWAIENGMQVINLSLSTAREEYYGLFHQLADMAYFKGVLLVSAVNNTPAPSYPSLYAAVVSVAAHEGRDPFEYYYNPAPPVEFGAPGIDVEVAWKDGQTLLSTGNSFAAPHITGLAALIRAKHPDLTPFQVKAVLHACAANVRRRDGS